VGGDPGTFGLSVACFHEWCARIAASWPDTLLTLSTHDTKRSGDVRARLDLLSEIPSDWAAAVRRWAEHNERHRHEGYPDRNLEYLAYQTLVGAWPLDSHRLTEFLLKAAREAKVHTSWTDPVAAYEDAVARFAAATIADAEFQAGLEEFIATHDLVAHGRTASLAQTALLLTCPGVPDIYQGSELWSLTLVDPDNRERPVDYDARRALLAELANATPEEALARADEGAPKLWLTARLLARKREWSGYERLQAEGAKARHAVAFQRDDLIVVVPRLVLQLAGDWGDTTVPLPVGSWIDVLTEEPCPGGRRVEVRELTRRFPVAVLERA
jgi:(1->4)-alpha-D-glucan 1-alpha-D-glucosylmutase